MWAKHTGNGIWDRDSQYKGIWKYVSSYTEFSLSKSSGYDIERWMSLVFEMSIWFINCDVLISAFAPQRWHISYRQNWFHLIYRGLGALLSEDEDKIYQENMTSNIIVHLAGWLRMQETLCLHKRPHDELCTSPSQVSFLVQISRFNVPLNVS